MKRRTRSRKPARYSKRRKTTRKTYKKMKKTRRVPRRRMTMRKTGRKFSIKKNARNYQVSSTRRFPHTTISLASLRRMMNLESPCWKFYSDAVAYISSAAQKQNWIFFGVGDNNSRYVYHRYNPLVGDAPTIDEVFMTTPQTVVEWTKNTLYLINVSLNQPVLFHAYLVKPRRNITYKELNESTGGSGLGITSTSTRIYHALFDLAKCNTDATYKTNPAPSKTMQHWNWDDLGEVPFNNPWFCRNFKIIRTKKWSIGPGRRSTITMQNGRDRLNGYRLGFQFISGDATSADIAMTPKYTRMWMVAFHSQHQIFSSNDYKKIEAFTAPTASVLTYHTRQFCIRIDSSQPQPLLGRLNSEQNIDPSYIPLHIGGHLYPGELQPTVVATTGIPPTISMIPPAPDTAVIPDSSAAQGWADDFT